VGNDDAKPDVDALKKGGDVEELTEALSSNDSEIRYSAIGALGRLKALTPLIRALDDVEGKHRALAAHYIGQIEINSHKSQATKALVGLLQDDYETARYNAAEALQLIGDRRAEKPLKRAHSKEHELVVRNALERAIKRCQ
jgi:HEAT repeat protein